MLTTIFLISLSLLGVVLLFVWRSVKMHAEDMDRPVTMRWNCANGIIVLVTNGDYKVGRRRHGFIIPEWMLVCRDKVVPENYVQNGIARFSPGSYNDFTYVFDKRTSKKEENLFVPGISEKLLSFEEQKKILCSIDRDDFLGRLNHQNKDIVTKFWEMINHFFRQPQTGLRNPWLVTSLLALLSVVPMFALVAIHVKKLPANDQGPHLTIFNARHEVQTLNFGEKDWPPMRDVKEVQLTQVTSEPEDIGGGLVTFNTVGAGNHDAGAMGSKALGLKRNQKVYLRLSEGLTHLSYVATSFTAITEPEAQALIKDAGYKLVKYIPED